MKINSNSRTLGIFFLITLLLLGVSFVAYFNIDRLVKAGNWVDHTHEVLERLENMLSSMKDVERGTRGFLVSGEQGYLEPYQNGLELIHTDLAKLEVLVKDNALQSQKFQELKPYIRKKLDLTRELIETAPSKQQEAAFQSLFLESKKAMDQILMLGGEMKYEEYRLLKERDLREENFAKNTKIFILVSNGGAVLLLSIVFIFLYRGRINQQKAERERDNFFALSMDMLCVVGNDGYFKRVNPSFEKLLGFSAQELLSRTLFDFIHPEDRERSLNELKKLSEGADTVNFENRFLCKDGNHRWLSWNCPALEAGHDRLYAVARDITERRKVDQMKNEFISTVSHELRTPLTSIRGSLGLVSAGMVGSIPDQAKPLITIALNNCERLVRLINDILDIEKIESGKMEFKLTPIPLLPLLEQSIEMNRAYGEQFKVRFTLERGSLDPVVNLDSDKLIQVMSNLLSNAAKFSPPDSEVRVKLSAQEGKVRVSVVDQGAGIPEEFRKRIFGKFAQADSSDTRQKGGTGLGLSIVKAIVERMNGKIDFETEVGKGSVFYFELPEWQGKKALVKSHSSLEPKILICEDDPDVARLLSLMLEKAGYVTDVAFTGEQALDLLKVRKYDAMTLDLLLPDQEGSFLISEIRQESSTKNLPIIVISVKAETERKKLEAAGLNVLDWINKPIDPARLHAAFDKIFPLKNIELPKILHVEDDFDTTQWVATLFQNAAQLFPAYSFREAREKIEKELFDLILLDILLPDGDGAELLPYIQLKYKPLVPVVILSSKESNEEIQKRVAAVLVKSRTTNEDLLHTIQSALKKGS